MKTKGRGKLVRKVWNGKIRWSVLAECFVPQIPQTVYIHTPSGEVVCCDVEKQRDFSFVRKTKNKLLNQ